MGFRDRGVEPSDGFRGDGFVVRPLTPSDVVLDHDAVMASREFLFHWEQDPPYPSEDFSVEDNLDDLVKIDRRHGEGARYTYTVMDPAERTVLGCVYLIPADDALYRDVVVTGAADDPMSSVDAMIYFWVRPSTWAQGFERTLLGAVLQWIDDDWSVEQPVVITNEALSHQIASIESLGLRRRFDFRRAKDMYLSHAYSTTPTGRTVDVQGRVAQTST